MFTSRAEFRLQLREDNADVRLTEVGRQLGLVDDVRWDAFSRKRDAVSRETQRLKALWASPKNVSAAEAERVFGKALEHEYNLLELLRRPDVNYAGLMSLESGKFADRRMRTAIDDSDDDDTLSSKSKSSPNTPATLTASMRRLKKPCILSSSSCRQIWITAKCLHSVLRHARRWPSTSLRRWVWRRAFLASRRRRFLCCWCI